MKKILVTNGTNDCTGETRASTRNGYIKAAKRIWPYVGLQRVKIRVFDFDLKDQNPIVFETMTDICF